MKIWYDEPAPYWEGALPIGNGKIGAMVYGGIERETLQLNEDTIWSGPGEYGFDKNAPQRVAQARDLIREGKYSKATEFIDSQILLERDECQSYQTAGFLFIDFDLPDGETSGFQRSLSLETGVASQRFERAGVVFERESFVSFPDGVMCVRITASQPGSVGLTTSFESPMPYFTPYSVDGHTVAARGRTASVNPNYARGRFDINSVWDESSREKPAVRYVETVRAQATGADATVSASDGHIHVSRADEAVLFIRISTGFQGPASVPQTDFALIERQAIEITDKAQAIGYTAVRERHVDDHRSLFSRVEFHIGGDENDDQPTDRRIKSCGAPEDDPGLVELLYQYGRYLLIASSRAGSEPANLQGIWNQYLQAPWGGRYTININTEMNYWHAQTCNLGECEEPLLRMVEELSAAGRGTAETMYGCRGWCSHHNTDLWRWTGLVHFKTRHAFWPMSGAWLARNIWEKYCFDGDVEYLREHGLPVLEGACRFMLDFMVEENGELVISPSSSPENGFVDPQTGRVAEVCAGSTVDQSIVRELFETSLAAAKATGASGAIWNEITSALPRIKTPGIGARGQLLEYSGDFEEPEPHHRHVSHLYGAYPGAEFTPDRNPDLYEAARTSLDFRGDKTTGWGMGWRVALWARFLDGDRALGVVGNLLSFVVPKGETRYDGGGGVFLNLMDAHPPFQIDGNFGVTAGIAEMLMQSHLGRVDILPALPAAWSHGSIKGLRARGGFQVSIRWHEGRLESCEMTSLLGKPLELRCNGLHVEMDTEIGKTYTFDSSLELK